MCRLILSFFKLLKKDSATALTLPTVPTPTHAGQELVVLAPAVELIGSKLTALV
jgi:hypothetical protein